ncbi:protein of unknown function [Nitrospira defluvii]|uniref:Uncharacterized protein n=1 Tax=Nitrospira defluvii TaxID=330214 RepID=D8P7V9_9BACT|nr:protein of unknown function [Nitrospira defluvii]
MFITRSLLWGCGANGTGPARFDVVGAVRCLIGMVVILYRPRPPMDAIDQHSWPRNPTAPPGQGTFPR